MPFVRSRTFWSSSSLQGDCLQPSAVSNRIIHTSCVGGGLRTRRFWVRLFLRMTSPIANLMSRPNSGSASKRGLLLEVAGDVIASYVREKKADVRASGALWL